MSRYNDTVWLGQTQMVELFGKTKQNMQPAYSHYFQQGPRQVTSQGPKGLAIGVIAEAASSLEHFRVQLEAQAFALLHDHGPAL